MLLRRAAAGSALLGAAGWWSPRTVTAAAVGRLARPAPATDFASDVATAWFDELRALIGTTPGYSPPVASRAIAYGTVSLYEALLPGMPGQRSLAGQLQGLQALPAQGANAAYHWPSVANAALAEIARLLFPGRTPERRVALETLEAIFEAQGVAAPGIRARSIERGQTVARAVFDWSTSDGGHEGFLRNFPTTYTPPVGPGLWEPTPPAFSRPLQPFWGANRRFLADVDDDPGGPTSFSTDPGSACFVEAFEVYATVNELSTEQLAIARFWSDDPGATSTPPGHSLSILTQVLRATDASLAVAATAAARLGIAVADAFIACWATKYRWNVLRPITYVRAHIDPAWGDPLPLVTPPFPEYTSGHSVQSGAAAAVLTAAFGATSFTDHTHDARGLAPRSFSSFDAAASEAAISRLYGGIHYRPAIELGLLQGRAIGERAAALPLLS